MRLQNTFCTIPDHLILKLQKNREQNIRRSLSFKQDKNKSLQYCTH